MEPVLPSQNSGAVAPWQADYAPGSGLVMVQCAAHVRRELGISALQVLVLFTQDEWHSLLLDAYHELVAIGEISPAEETEHGKG